MPLSLTLFGPPRLLRGSEAVRGRGVQKRRVALMSILAGSSEYQATRDRLVGLLWTETEPAQARRLLTEAVYVIRSEVDEQLISSSGDSLALDPRRLDCDLWRFRDAASRGSHRTVLELAQQPLLDGWYLDNAPEFERWSDAMRTETEETLERSIRALAKEHELGAEWRAAADVWRRATRIDPLSSEFSLNLARALDRAGEAAHALAALRAHEDALRSELEVGPGTEVLSAIERLRRARPATPASQPRIVTPVEPPVVVDEADAAADDEGEVPSSNPTQPPRPEPPRRARGLAYATAALIAIVALGFAYQTRAVPLTPIRLAVRYIDNESTRPNLDGVADELTHSLIAHLAYNDAFEVVPASGSRRFRDRSVGSDSLARALRATHIVEGRLNVMGEQVMGSVRLLDATGRLLGERSFVRDPTYLVYLRDEIPRDVAAMIRTTLGREVRLRQIRWGSRNSRAFNLFAQANHAMQTGRQLLSSLDASARASAIRSLRVADSIFVEAQGEDPRWFEPRVGQARAALLLARADPFDRRHVILDSALRRMEAALPSFAPNAAMLEATAALRWARVMAAVPAIDTVEAERAIRELDEALRVEPKHTRSLTLLASIRFFMNEYALAELTAREALAADAYLEEAPAIFQMLFVSNVYLMDFAEAERICLQGRVDYPDDWWFVECQLTLLKYRTDLAPDTIASRRLIVLADSLDPPSLAKTAGHAYAPFYRRLIHAALAVRAGDRQAGRAAIAEARAAARVHPEIALDMMPDEVTLLLLFNERQRARALFDSVVKQRPLLRGLAERDPLLRQARLSTP